MIVNNSQLEALGQFVPPPRHVLYQCHNPDPDPYLDPWPRSPPKFNSRSLSFVHWPIAMQPSLKSSCKSVQKFLRKVANRQTYRQRLITCPPWWRQWEFITFSLTSMPLDSVMSQSSLLRVDELNKSRLTCDQLRIGSNRVFANEFVFALADSLLFMVVGKWCINLP